jgi:hypothetical protein
LWHGLAFYAEATRAKAPGSTHCSIKIVRFGNTAGTFSRTTSIDQIPHYMVHKVPPASKFMLHHLPGHGNQPLLVGGEADGFGAQHAVTDAVLGGGRWNLLADHNRPPLCPMFLLLNARSIIPQVFWIRIHFMRSRSRQTVNKRFPKSNTMLLNLFIYA